MRSFPPPDCPKLRLTSAVEDTACTSPTRFRALPNVVSCHAMSRSVAMVALSPYLRRLCLVPPRADPACACVIAYAMIRCRTTTRWTPHRCCWCQRLGFGSADPPPRVGYRTVEFGATRWPGSTSTAAWGKASRSGLCGAHRRRQALGLFVFTGSARTTVVLKLGYADPTTVSAAGAPDEEVTASASAL